jgi:hypothetical protein
MISAFATCSDAPVEAIRLLEMCKRLPPHSLWLHAKEIVDGVKVLVQPSVPRKIQGTTLIPRVITYQECLNLYLYLWAFTKAMYKYTLDLFRDVWYLLNNIFPRHLWEMTSNALLPYGSAHLNVDELTLDPLQILRCDSKVFRCAPIMSILLHILAASLAASRYYLGKHVIVSCKNS